MDSTKLNEENKRKESATSGNEVTREADQVNDFQPAREHGDYRPGDSDSEYPASQPEDIERERRERMQEGYTIPNEKKDLSDNNISSNDPTESFLEDNPDNEYRGLTREGL